jgi:hypothetical protein
MLVQRERMQGGKAGEDSHRKFKAGWKTGRPWLDFRKVTTTDHDSAGNSVLVTAMFCKWCEMAGFNHNDRGKPTVWTDAGGGCQRAKVESVKDHEVTQTHKEAANLQMNQSDMKEAVKTAILQNDHVLLNLTSIILSMAKNHDSLASFPARCLAAEMLSVEVKTKGEDGNVTRDTHHVNLEQAYRTRTFAREILYFMSEEVRSGIREDFMKSKFFGHALDEATAKTKNQHVIQYISYWRRGWEVGVIKAFDKKGPHAGKFSVKYKDDPNWWTHSLLREGYGKDKHWVLLGLPSRDSA